MDYSVVIEWDNARFSERERPVSMLRALGKQAAEFSARRPPVKITFDPANVDVSLVRTCLDEAGPAMDHLDIEFLPVENSRYYSQKNYGFSRTESQFVIFLDSDVIPQPSWLKNLLGSFEHPDVDVACGETFMACSSNYERAFALFWFFNLQDKQPRLVRRNHFFANNVAFRREIFAQYNFPELDSFRGQCLALAHDLRRSGIPIFCNTGASVEHPPPVDGRMFVRRALSAGYDETILNKALDRPFHQRGPLGAGWRFATHLWRSGMKTITRHRDVGLTPAGAVPALCLAGSFYTLKLLGELISLIDPTLFASMPGCNLPAGRSDPAERKGERWTGSDPFHPEPSVPT